MITLLGSVLKRIGALIKLADWSDVAAKAKRLVRDGQVTILRNSPTHIMAHVIGDHGEYDVEISRHDPNSQVIEQWNCFLADAPVTMADGSRKLISEIKPGDLVLTHKGNVRPVLNVWSRSYDGEIARIRLSGMSEEIVATTNHPFWAANEDFHHARRNGWEGKYKSAHHQNRRGAGKIDYALATRAKGGFAGVPLEPATEWVEAGSLEECMYLSMAAPVGEIPLKFEDVRVEGDVAYLLGWYIAEGFIIKSTKNRVGFALSPDEWHVAEELSRICAEHFGTPGTIRKADHTIDFRVSSAKLRQMVEKLVGSGTATKSLHSSIITMPIKDQERLLDGWWNGDGSQDGNRRVLSTVSESLANQARLILARMGIDSVVTSNDNNFGNGFVQNARRIYQIKWQPEHRRFDAERFFKDGQVWMKIVSVEVEPYKGEVWDIEVAGDHSFQAFSVNCHNCECPWAQYAWDRTRKWKKYEGRPCSHVIAAYWKARSTPLDLEGMEEEYQAPRGQRVAPIGERPGEQGELPGMPKPEPFPIPQQRFFTPEEQAQREEELKRRMEQLPPTPPIPPGVSPSTRDIGIGPTPQSPLPVTTQPAVPQREPLRLFDITSIPGAQAPAPTSPVSIPGGRPPSPTNPVQLPGTFSHWIPVVAIKTSEFIMQSADELTEYFEQQRKLGQPIYVALQRPVLLERSGGKIPVPGAVPYDVSKEGIPLYRVVDLGYNPATGQRENADVNALQGAPEWTGQYTEAAANRRAEVLDYDPELRMAYIMVPLHYEGQDVRLHPHSLKGWVDYRDIRPAPGGNPFRRKR